MGHMMLPSSKMRLDLPNATQALTFHLGVPSIDLSNSAPRHQATPLLGTLSNEWTACVHTKTFTDIHSSVIPNRQKMEAI